MVYRKGERRDTHREAEYPHAVDILVRYPGLGQDLNRIHAAIKPLGGEQWGYRAFDERGVYRDWIRIGFKDNRDAARIAWQFWYLWPVRAR